MEVWVELINKVQDHLQTLQEQPIELPRIVVVGAQSSGKSSVLETLVKRSFLPRGVDMVTRCPLELRLYNTQDGSLQREDGALHDREWAEFKHRPGEEFDLNDIHQEIENRTEQLTGSKSDCNISNEPIILEIYSPNVPRLTLIDLPGVIKNRVPSQPKDIVQSIRKLVLGYIKNPLSIILAIVTANTHIQTSESLEMAREADPDGTRTLAVVTKLDLVDRGTSGHSVLNGDLIPVKLGIVGVLNRSQEDINNHVTIEAALARERRFFELHYPDIKERHGSPYLQKTLEKLLVHHIQKMLPKIMSKLREEIQHCQVALDSCGEAMNEEEKTNHLCSMISQFTITFKNVVDARGTAPCNGTLCGGAKIRQVFELWKQELDQIKPCEGTSQEEVYLMIKNSNGMQSPQLLPESIFEALLMPLIRKLEQPALRCVEDIMQELKSVSVNSLPPFLSELQPLLKAEMARLVEDMIVEFSQKAKQMIRDSLYLESNYVNYIMMLDIERLVQMYSSKTTLSETFQTDPQFRAKQGPDFDPKLIEVGHNEEGMASLLGKLLTTYFKDVISIRIYDTVIKATMTYLVLQLKNKMEGRLNVYLNQEDVMEAVFQEDASVVEKRADNSKKLKVWKKSMEDVESAVRKAAKLSRDGP